MSWESGSRRLLAAATAALLLSSAPAALAQEKVKTPRPAEAEAAAPSFALEIPEIHAENSTLDAEAIRRVFEGDFSEHLPALASLDADRIAIPEIRFTISSPGYGADEMVYRDIELVDVRGGVAASVTVGEVTSTSTTGEITGSFGALSAVEFDIAALLGFYGLYGAGGSTDFAVIYRDMTLEGGTFEGPDFSCELGAVTNAEFRARPVATPFTELLQIIADLEAAGEEPDAEQMRPFIDFYLDFVTAFDSAPTVLDGVACEWSGEQAGSLDIGPITLGAFAPGRYPSLTASEGGGIHIDSQPPITFVYDEIVIKGFDYSEQVALLRQMPSENIEAWFEANGRRFIPAFEGFSLSGIAVDAINPDTGEPLSFQLGLLDLSLSDHVNGIPTRIGSLAENFVFDLPEGLSEEAEVLRALGVERLDLGYAVGMSWDEAGGTIGIDTISVNGADLGSLAIAGALANATAELFSDNPDTALEAAMGLTVTDLRVDIEDAGIVDLILAFTGAEQGATPQQLRPMMAGVAEGMTIGVLGGGEMAMRVGAAIGSFLRSGSGLTLTVTPVDPAGIGITDLMAAEQDPNLLVEQVNIDAAVR